MRRIRTTFAILLLCSIASAEMEDDRVTLEAARKRRVSAQPVTSSSELPTPPVPARAPSAAAGKGFTDSIGRAVEKQFFEVFGDPWTLQGLPILFPSPESGFNLGVRIGIQNIRRMDPHKMELEMQVLASDRGRFKHYFRIDVPHALNDRFRFTGRVSYDRDITLPYFGIGNSPSVDRRNFSLDDPRYQNTRSVPSAQFQLLAYLTRTLRMGPLLGFKWASIQYPVGSLMDIERPVGIAGGRTHYVGFGIIYDTLDWEPYPSRGMYHELFTEVHGPIVGSQYRFERYTYTFRSYHRLHRRLVFAHRTLFERLSGEAPFYELGALGGSNSSVGFGSDRFFRGYEVNMFIDRFRWASSFEMRWDPAFFQISKEDVTLGIVPFVDVGRVWGMTREVDLRGIHASLGLGVRFNVGTRLTLRADYALTRDGQGFYVNIGNAF